MAYKKNLIGRLLEFLKSNNSYVSLYNAVESGLSFYSVLPYSNLRGNTSLFVAQGRGPQHLDPNTPVDIEFNSYLNLVVMPTVTSYKRKNPEHPFDDRKLRLDNFYLDNNNVNSILSLRLGPTEYQRYRQDLQRKEIDAIELMLLGIQAAGDPYYFFSKTLGVAAILLSSEGYAFLGERLAHIDYPGYLGGFGGLATFYSDLNHVNFISDIQNEIAEETSVSPDTYSSTFQFIGISGSVFTSEMDLVFIVETSLPYKAFIEMQLTEHQRMIGIRNRKEAFSLVINGLLPGQSNKDTKLLFSTRFAMEHLLRYHF